MVKKSIKKILIISHKSPYTHVDGGVLAIRKVFEGLNNYGIDTELITLSTQKHPHKKELVPTEFENKINWFSINTEVKKWDAFTHLLANKSYNLSRFYDISISKEIRKQIQTKNYDCIILESLFSAVYLTDIRKVFDKKIVLRSHNIEWKIWDRLANNSPSKLKTWYLKQLVKSLKKEEEAINNDVDAIFSISEKDKMEYAKQHNTPVHLLSHTRAIKARKGQLVSNRFFHLAAMDWLPNLEAVEWLVDNVWKEVQKQNPNVELVLAGKDMPKKYFDMKGLNITAFDYIENGDQFMQDNGILLVPLFSGSGIRIKIVDALSLSVPVISTNIGVEGIPVTENSEYILAQNKEQFVNAILQLTGQKANQIAQNALAFAKLNFDANKVYANFVTQLENL
jgi:glycosyltransferase involved in cell wall biosynthesis